MRWRKCGIDPRDGRLCGLPYGKDGFHVEEAEVRFAEEMLEIYRPYVERTAISFEIEPPSLDEFEWRVKSTRDAHYPWLMACVGDRIVGYAYAGPFKNRAAYAPPSIWFGMRFGMGMDGGSIRRWDSLAGQGRMPTPASRIRIGAIRISHGRAYGSIPRWDSGVSGSLRTARRSLVAFIP